MININLLRNIYDIVKVTGWLTSYVQNIIAMKKLLMLLVISSAIFFGCKDDDNDDDNNNTTPPTTGNVVVVIEHGWGSNYLPFSLGTWYTQPATGDSIQYTRLQYYVSNIRLQLEDGTWWSENNSYRLVNENSLAERTLTLTNVPVGKYNRIEIMIGVDSAMSLSGVQMGPLDPANGMYWSWQTGYIFIKSEGFSPQASLGNFQYHMGGFMGSTNAIQVRSFNLTGKEINLQGGKTSTVKMKANAARFWHGGIKIANISIIHSPSDTAKLMAGNFADGFFVESVTN
jgi:hypothetical protein